MRNYHYTINGLDDRLSSDFWSAAYSELKRLIDVKFEEVIIGTLMSQPSSLADAIEVFGDRPVFALYHTDRLYSVIMDLYRENKSYDIVSVTTRLKAMGYMDEIPVDSKFNENTGGEVVPVYISRLVNDAYLYDAQWVDGFVQFRELYQRRQAIVDSVGIIEKIKNPEFSIEDNRYDVMNGLTSTLSDDLVQDDVEAHKTLDLLHKKLAKDGAEENDNIGFKLGIKKIDTITNGFQPGHMITVAGRPGMGKTAFLKLLIKQGLESGVPVCIFSLEMNKEEFMVRLISEEVGKSNQEILGNKLSSGDLGKVKYMANKYYVDGKPLLIIDDDSEMTAKSFRVKVKRYCRLYGVKLVATDYLQLMKGAKNSFSRESEVSEISRSHKIAAKENNIPVIALSQLNREVEKRKDCRPQLADLRESGSIEQDSDQVFLLYRPWYYHQQGKKGFGEISINGKPDSSKNYCEIIMAKNRHGSIDNSIVGFDGKLTKFYDLDEKIEAKIDQSEISFNDNDDDLPF